MRELCFSLAFVNEGAYHLILARMEIDPERNMGAESRESATSLLHYDASVEQLRKQLLGPFGEAHETIIGVIINLACHDVSITTV